MKKLSFLQLNLHNSATVNLAANNWILQSENNIALCQEPNQTRNKVNNIHPQVRQYVGTHPISKIRPRACILINSTKLRLLKLTQFCDRDLVSILVDNEIVLASCYMEGEPEIPPPPPAQTDCSS